MDTQLRQIEREMNSGDYTNILRYHAMLVRRHATDTSLNENLDYYGCGIEAYDSETFDTLAEINVELMRSRQIAAFRTDPADGINATWYIGYTFAFCPNCNTQLEHGTCPNYWSPNEHIGASSWRRNCTRGIPYRAGRLRYVRFTTNKNF